MTKHTCKFGCGYSHQKRGAINLHERYHCPTLKNGAGDPQQKKNGAGDPQQRKKSALDLKGVTSNLKCGCDSGPELAFMNKADPRFFGALAAGYKRVCVECGEVFK